MRVILMFVADVSMIGNAGCRFDAMRLNNHLTTCSALRNPVVRWWHSGETRPTQGWRFVLIRDVRQLPDHRHHMRQSAATWST